MKNAVGTEWVTPGLPRMGSWIPLLNFETIRASNRVVCSLL